MQGVLSKMHVNMHDPVEYSLCIGEKLVPLNQYIGKKLTLTFTGKIQCIYCARAIKKTFNQGYCFVCLQKLARCDSCIIHPEKCHFHLDTCREPDWGLAHCFKPHIIYLAISSGVKIGITRKINIPTRWIDQGAIQALPVMEVVNRYHAGVVELELKKLFNDKTNWRTMLKGEIELDDLQDHKAKIIQHLSNLQSNNKILQCALAEGEFIEQEIVKINYPVINYPSKINSLNFDKDPKVSGLLEGIKGQYLIFSHGVINIRKFTGYEVSLAF